MQNNNLSETTNYILFTVREKFSNIESFNDPIMYNGQQIRKSVVENQ